MVLTSLRILRHWLAPSLLLWAGLAAVPAAAQNVAHGQTLFNQICVSCHGFPPLGGPELAPNNPALITSAINGLVPAMAFLRPILSASDIADIAAYLGTLSGPAPPPPPPTPPVPAFDYTDLWWAGEGESGWGINITQHPSHKIFAVVYTYDMDRRPMWLVLPDGTWSSPTLYSGPFYRVTGPAQTGAPWDFSKVKVVQVGIATLSFTDRDHANFQYSVGGVQVSKALSRTPF